MLFRDYSTLSTLAKSLQLKRCVRTPRKAKNCLSLPTFYPNSPTSTPWHTLDYLAETVPCVARSMSDFTWTTCRIHAQQDWNCEDVSRFERGITRSQSGAQRKCLYWNISSRRKLRRISIFVHLILLMEQQRFLSIAHTYHIEMRKICITIATPDCIYVCISSQQSINSKLSMREKQSKERERVMDLK